VLLAVATTRFSLSVTTASAKAIREPYFTTVPTTVNGPVVALTARR
jgi:hypothetical protein